MFRALLAYPQEALNNQHLVYYVRVMSVGCTTVKVISLYWWFKETGFEVVDYTELVQNEILRLALVNIQMYFQISHNAGKKDVGERHQNC
jgi:hypothetical protein